MPHFNISNRKNQIANAMQNMTAEEIHREPGQVMQPPPGSPPRAATPEPEPEPQRRRANTTHVKARRLELPLVVPTGLTPAPVDKETPSVSWVTVTPDLAAQWIDECNTNNRAVRQEHVDKLAHDMASGKWKGLNAEPIKFDSNGRLIEGQHRCWACVISGCSFETMLVTGCHPEDYNTSGIGRPKSFIDFLGPNHGQHNTPLLSAACRIVYLWENDMLASTKSKTVPISALEEAFLAHPDLPATVSKVMTLHATRRLLTGSYCCLLHYAGTREGRQYQIEMFLESLGEGVGLMADDPVYQLRKFLLGQRQPQPGRRRAGRIYILALAIKAWNMTKAGRKAQGLMFRSDESFPKL